MKKVILTTILFISSFFFFNLKNVSAATINITLTEENFSLINDDFLDFRNQVIEFCGDSKSYIIYYDPNNASSYRVLIADNDSYSLYFEGYNYDAWFGVNNFDIYKYENKLLTFDSTISSQINITIISSNSTPNFRFLDTNISDITFKGLYYFRINYNDVSYSIPSSNLYSIYLANLPPEPEESYEEEKGLLSSFYTCIIEKISYLATEFATNYIFLIILGVFVLIYVIELFRRLLR